MASVQKIGTVGKDGTLLLQNGRVFQWNSPDPQRQQKIGLRFNGGGAPFTGAYKRELEKKPPLCGRQ